MGIDIPKVTTWLSNHVEGAVAPFQFDIIAGGRSNLTFTVTDASGHKVPPGLYLFSLEVEADVGSVFRQGVVNVVY